MQLVTSLLYAATAVNAHYTFSALIVDGKSTGDWSAVRKPKNWQNNGPVQDVMSNDIRCFELAPGTPAAQTVNVTAGQEVGFQANPNIYHPGPLAFYMAKAPAGQTASTFDGSGSVWFKIFEDQPNFGGSALTWPSNGLKTPSVKIPQCIPDGDYLLRIEHIGLHTAQSVGAAQFYLSCAQITVSGGGNTTPSGTVSLPGAYAAGDPGIEININYPVPKEYVNPGPKPFTC